MYEIEYLKNGLYSSHEIKKYEIVPQRIHLMGYHFFSGRNLLF